MTTENFVRALKELTLNKNALLNKGLSEKYVNELLDSFDCVWIRKSAYKDPLLILIDSYKASIIRIGNIDFGQKVGETDSYFIIGEVEVDLLVIDKHTGIVKIVEKEIYTDMWECAANGSKFLTAILEAQRFLLNVVQMIIYIRIEK
ncbi:MAG: hypothetical protein KIT62_03100 [Cyclobacteriaceae bacterium]|nr:hypothetical protein [Cyclobacteriaceae bacterium]